jgi:hypothetical protein
VHCGLQRTLVLSSRLSHIIRSSVSSCITEKEGHILCGPLVLIASVASQASPFLKDHSITGNVWLHHLTTLSKGKPSPRSLSISCMFSQDRKVAERGDSILLEWQRSELSLEPGQDDFMDAYNHPCSVSHVSQLHFIRQ